MAKITRQTFIQFGTSANPASEIGQFGAYATLDYSNSISVLQAGTAWTRGWYGETINTNRPFIQDMNAIDYVYSYMIFYLLEMGLAEYDAGTTYYTNSRCQYSGVSYVSLVDNNTGNTPGSASSTYWQASGSVLGANIASASSIRPGSDGTIFNVTGTTTITSILNPNAIKEITLIFTGVLTVTNSATVVLNNGNFTTAANSTLELVWNGSNWIEVARSPLPAQVGFGAWNTSFSFGANYHASTDGFVVATIYNGLSSPTTGPQLVGFSDSSSTPTTVRACSWGQNVNGCISITFPVRKGDYWSATASSQGGSVSGYTSLYWLPLGS